MIILGVDPGLNGGVMAYDGTGKPFGFRIPSQRAQYGRGREMDCDALASLFFQTISPGITKAYLERVAARPGQGVASMFKFGYVTGILRGMLIAYQIPVELVTPQAWKKHFGLTGTTKEASKALCRELFTTDFGNDGQAEASLIAKYGYDKYKREIS